MGKVLYGAAVQGIQAFIFQTNKLKEIIGASELVEQVCTTLFANLVFNGADAPFDVKSLSTNQKELSGKLLSDDNQDCLVAAAGNVKYLFDEETCKMVYRHFPRQVSLLAPGITISQAVVRLAGDKPTQQEINLLEDRLRARRNTPWPMLETGWAVTDRVPRTGLPAVDNKGKGKERRDKAMVQKLAALETARHALMTKLSGHKDLPQSMLPQDMQDLVRGRDDQWMAVVHADGNSLGDIIRSLAENKGSEAGSIFRKFSRALDAATQEAAQKAFVEVFATELEKGQVLGIRPVVIGGDDITFLCRADKALGFTAAFLKYFEEQTKKYLKELTNDIERKQLSACAGIAFIKSSYPVHYGMSLAEQLCGVAKVASKKLVVEGTNDVVPASLAFHKVQDSFLGEWKEMAQKEMTYKQAGYSELDFNYGPYAVKAEDADGVHLNDLGELLTMVDLLQESDAPKSGIRQWLTELNLDFGAGDVRMGRLCQVLQKRGSKYIHGLQLNAVQDLKSTDKKTIKSPLYHALMLTSIS